VVSESKSVPEESTITAEGEGTAYSNASEARCMTERGPSERGMTKSGRSTKSTVHATEPSMAPTEPSMAPTEPSMAPAEPSMAPAATTVSTTTVSATATPTPGRSSERQTGGEDQRRGESDHQLAHHDVSSICCEKHSLSVRAPQEFVLASPSRRPMKGRDDEEHRSNRDKQSNQNVQMTNKSVSDMEVSFWIFTLVTK
jgi:hypothetical protein